MAVEGGGAMTAFGRCTLGSGTALVRWCAGALVWESGVTLALGQAVGYLWNLQLYPLTPSDPYRGRTALLTSKRCILYIQQI